MCGTVCLSVFVRISAYMCVFAYVCLPLDSTLIPTNYIMYSVHIACYNVHVDVYSWDCLYLWACERIYEHWLSRCTTHPYAHVRVRDAASESHLFSCLNVHCTHTQSVDAIVFVGVLVYEQCRLHVGTLWAIPSIKLFHIEKPICFGLHCKPRLRQRRRRRKQ